MNMRLKQVVAGGALVAGLLGGGAAVAWAQTSPTAPPASTPSSGSGGTAPSGATAPGGTAPGGGGSAGCPNM